MVHARGGVHDGPVAGAAAQVARQRVLRLLARDGGTGALVVQREQAHHEAGSAETALRAVAFDHRALRRVQLLQAGRRAGALAGRRLGDVLGGPDGLAVHAVRQPDAAVDGTHAQAAVGPALAHGHGAGAAVTAGAALLHRGAVQVVAQQLQQRAVGWYIAQRDNFAAPQDAHGPRRAGGHGGKLGRAHGTSMVQFGGMCVDAARWNASCMPPAPGNRR